MNLLPRLLPAFACIFGALIACFSFLLVVQQRDSLNQLVRVSNEAARAMLAQRQKILLGQYQGRLKSLVASRPEVIAPFAAREREELLRQSVRLEQVLHRENPWFLALYFILPDNHVFLRVQKPEYHGDDAGRLSPLIARGNSTRQPAFGFEVVRGGLHYRLVHPVFHQGRYVGLLGFGIDSRYLLDGLDEQLGCDVALALPRTAASTMTWFKENLVEQGDFLLLPHRGTLFSQAVAALNPHLEMQRLQSADRHYFVLGYPLTGLQGEELGRILLAHDITDMVRDGRVRLIQTLVLGVALLAVALLLLSLVLGKLLRHNRELTENLQRSNENLEERVAERTRALEQETTQRRQAEERAERARRMEAIGLMAGGVAHDLNNILSGLTSYPEFLLTQVPRDSSLREPLQSIQESGHRAAAVVADLLTVARGVACVKQALPINQIVSSYLDSPETRSLRAAHPGIELVSDLRSRRSCRCSPMHLQKVLMNLVNNGFEALSETGRVRITTRDEEAVVAGPDGGASRVAPPCIVLTVEDTGHGIPEENLPHIFEPFYTKKKMGRSGTGLGLAVVWNAVRDHGGEITLDSSPAGTIFTIRLPACDEAEEGEGDGSALPLESLRGTGSILVVDDEAMQRDLATRMLRSLGYDVFSVASGEEALAFLQERHVDLLLLDMLMGGMNGAETYDAIRARNPAQKAVIVSGFSGSLEYDRARELGAAGLLQKPYSLAQLGQAVRKALRGWQ